MKYSEVLAYCLSFPDSQKRFTQANGKAFALLVGEQPFAFFETGAPIQWQFVIRVTQELFDGLYNPPQVRKTDRGDGYWIVIARVENFEEEKLKELIQWSYRKALSPL